MASKKQTCSTLPETTVTASFPPVWSERVSRTVVKQEGPIPKPAAKPKAKAKNTAVKSYLAFVSSNEAASQ